MYRKISGFFTILRTWNPQSGTRREEIAERRGRASSQIPDFNLAGLRFSNGQVVDTMFRRLNPANNAGRAYSF